MGSSKTQNSQSSTESGMNRVQFDPRSGSEQQILNQYQGLGDQQLSFINDLVRGGTSPFALNAKDQAQLDQAYNSAFNRFNQEGRDMADYLATTRGLNKSDTPVGAQVMDRYGMGMADLLSQRANAGLNLGLQGTNLRLMGSQALPSGLGAAFMPQFQERMSTPTQTFQGQGSSQSMQRNTPSLMQQIGQGLNLGAGMGLMAGGLMTGNPMMMMGGMGNMGGGGGLGGLFGGGGMGSGASANSWMGPTKGGQIGGMKGFFS